MVVIGTHRVIIINIVIKRSSHQLLLEPSFFTHSQCDMLQQQVAVLECHFLPIDELRRLCGLTGSTIGPRSIAPGFKPY